MHEIYPRLVDAARALGVAPGLVQLDAESSGDDFLHVTVGYVHDAPQAFPISIGIDLDHSVTMVVAPLHDVPGLRSHGEWMGEAQIPGGDVAEFAARWAAAAALGRLLLVRSPFNVSSLFFGRIGVLDPTDTDVAFGARTNRRHNLDVVRRFNPLG